MRVLEKGGPNVITGLEKKQESVQSEPERWHHEKEETQAVPLVLAWPKSFFQFFRPSYGKTQTNFFGKPSSFLSLLQDLIFFLEGESGSLLEIKL